MTFMWPLALAALVLVPVAVVGYVMLLRRRARRTAALAAQGFALNPAALRRRWRRHVPFVFFFAALTLLLVSLSRPSANVGIPRREGTVILAFDVSNSMLAKDIAPTRMEAAKVAAREFVMRQPSSILIGVVAFGDSAIVTQQPSNVQADVIAAIDRLTPQGGTSLGQGMFVSLGAIAGKPIALTEEAKRTGDLSNVDIGFFGSAAIVMLSDGENTSELDPLAVAELAGVAGVHVYPVGLGSPQGTTIEVGGFQMATALDEEMLQQIADDTDGTYYRASDAKSLSKVYSQVDLKLTSKARQTEITGALAGASTLLLIIGAGLSLAWFGRVV